MLKGGKTLTERLLKMEAGLSLLFFHVYIFILSFSKGVFSIQNDSAIVRTKYLIVILSFISIWIIFIVLFKDTRHKRDFIKREPYENIYKWLFETNPSGIFLFNDTKVIAINLIGERMMREKKICLDKKKYPGEKTDLQLLIDTALKSSDSFHVSNYKISNNENEYFFDIDALSGYCSYEKICALIINEDIKGEKCSEKNINSYIKDSTLEKRSIEILDKISHEIRTPLNILQGILHNSMDALNEIEDNEVKKRLTKDFEIYDRNIKRIQKLSNSFIGLIEIQYKDTLYLQRCDLINIIRSLSEASLLYALKKEKSVEFFSEIDSRFGDVDVDKFEKMILNLISNAIKFSNPKSIIYIRVREEEEKLVIEICSLGKMIEEGQKKDIFQLFNQGEKFMTRSTEGLGLGLYFVKEYIQMHKGEVEVRSDNNGYTVFTVHLPILNHKGIRLVDSAIEKDICKQKVEIEFSDL